MEIECKSCSAFARCTNVENILDDITVMIKDLKIASGRALDTYALDVAFSNVCKEYEIKSNKFCTTIIGEDG